MTPVRPFVPTSPFLQHSENSYHPLLDGLPNLTLLHETSSASSRVPDLPSLNPRSFISAMHHSSLMLFCYCFQMPWQHICKPRSGLLRGFLPATHSLFLPSLVPTTPDKACSPHPAYIRLNLLQGKGLFLAFSLWANNVWGQG